MLPAQKYRKPDSGAVLAALHQITEQFGYLPQDEIRKTAREMGIPLAQLMSAATFYASFTFKPAGKHKIHICDGTACHVKGSTSLMDGLKQKLGIGENETTQDGNFTLKGVRCLGSCGLAPALSIDGETHGSLTLEALDKILAEYSEAKR